MNTDVGSGADASGGQGLEDDRCVQARQTRTPDVWLNIDAPEAQLGRLAHGLHWERFLMVKADGDKLA